MKHIKLFECDTTTKGNIDGMGEVKSPQVSPIPGALNEYPSKKEDKVLNFSEFSKLNEDGEACATAGNSNGMGAVVAPQPGAVPGTTGTIGSGDVPAKDSIKSFNTPIKKKKKKKDIDESFEDKSTMYVTKYTDWDYPKN